MSKFHVGDKVRISDRDDLLDLFGLIMNDVSGVWTVGEPPYPSNPEDYGYRGPKIYWIQNELGAEWDVPEEVLRPADIKALPLEGDALVAEINKHAVTEAVDSVNHPAHYTRFPVEVINFTEQLDFNRGNAVKYIARAGFKEGVDELEDLSKAAWYINRAIEKLKSERAGQV